MLRSKNRLKNCRILIVEDEFFIGVDLIEELEREGATTLGPVSNIDDALSLIEERKGSLDAAILDINLHGELAFPVALALEACGVPFVFATGYDQRSLPRRYAHAPHHEKPVDPEMLVRTLIQLRRV